MMGFALLSNGTADRAGWLNERYEAPLLEAATQDLREYRGQLTKRQKPASVNATLAALRRFYGWATEVERLARNPALHLVDVAAQPLAPKGFSDTGRRRLRREAEHAEVVANAIVTTLLNTGLRVDELARLTWDRVLLQPRSGWVQVIGKA
jgi:site-specific recombinase XerD